MNEITIRLRSHKASLDPRFMDQMRNLAHQFGVEVRSEEPGARPTPFDQWMTGVSELRSSLGEVSGDSSEEIRAWRDEH